MSVASNGKQLDIKLHMRANQIFSLRVLISLGFMTECENETLQ